MEEAYQHKSVFKGSVAKVLNAGVNAAVHSYDATSDALIKVVKVVQKAPVLPQKAAGVFCAGLGAMWPSEIKEVEAIINEYEIKIIALYVEIGKEEAKCSDDENPLCWSV